MVKVTKNKLILYGITLFILLVISINIINIVEENFINYRKCKNRKINKALEFVLDKSMSNQNEINWDLYLPCSYTKIEKEISTIDLKENQAVFGIGGTDLIASKNLLYDILKSKYGSNVTKFYPKSYIPNNEKDILRFEKDFRKDKSYIFKKNLQQQKGIELSKNYNEILNTLKFNKNSVNIVQELLENPLIVGRRKINMRIYFLVICKGKSKKGYIFDDGFIYYTRKYYNKKILDFDHHITTGYIERHVYENNPLTHKDLYKKLDQENKGKSTELKNKIKCLMKNIFEAISPYICNKSNLKKGSSFQLFGCDVAPDKNLNCKLIEINKGPDMGFKDDRDGGLKKSVMGSIFHLLDIDDDMKNKKYNNRFISLN
jgi:hypothetical protein